MTYNLDKLILISTTFVVKCYLKIFLSVSKISEIAFHLFLKRA